MSKDNGKTIIHNTVEKVLGFNLLQCNHYQLRPKVMQEHMRKAIKLSGAHMRWDRLEPFLTVSDIPGSSDVGVLEESHFAGHTSTDENEGGHVDYFSGQISTCGDNTHPIKCVGYLVSSFNPVAGNINYRKVGMDLTRHSNFPMHAKTLVNRYQDQFDTKKYIFRINELKRGNYDLYFWDPAKIDTKEVLKHFHETKKSFRYYRNIEDLLVK